MKVIFLDIDGVLNTEVYVRHVYHFCKTHGLNYNGDILFRDEYGQQFDPMAVDMLRHVLKETDAKIVLSSTWRFSGLKTVQTMWEMRDLPGEIIDITPIFSICERGEEIAEWLRNNEVDSYLILDDDTDMLDEQKNNFVKTHPQYGLTSLEVGRCVEILNS